MVTGGNLFASILLFLVIFAPARPALAAPMERPVDAQLFCGQGKEGYAAAVAYIQTRATDAASIAKLTPEFACSLAAFLKAAPSAIGVKVGWYEVSASVATHGVSYCQRFQCKEGTNSHPRGLAADLLFGDTKGPGGNAGPAWCAQSTLCTWAHQNANSFGLMFRLMPNSGCAAGYFEPWHIELKGVAGCQGSDTFAGASASAAPLGIGNAFRSMIGNSSPSPQPAQSTTAAQPLSQTQSPLTSFEASPSQNIAQVPSSPVTETTNSASTANDAADRLAQLVFNEPVVATSTATSVPLIVSGAEAASLRATAQEVETASVTTTDVPAATHQTFISQDLSWQTGTLHEENPVQGWEAILIAIRSALMRMLPYLEPFGGREAPEAAS